MSDRERQIEAQFTGELICAAQHVIRTFTTGKLDPSQRRALMGVSNAVRALEIVAMDAAVLSNREQVGRNGE